MLGLRVREDPAERDEAARHDERGQLGKLLSWQRTARSIPCHERVAERSEGGRAIEWRQRNRELPEVPRPAAVVKVQQERLLIGSHQHVRERQVGVHEAIAIGRRAERRKPFADAVARTPQQVMDLVAPRAKPQRITPVRRVADHARRIPAGPLEPGRPHPSLTVQTHLRHQPTKRLPGSEVLRLLQRLAALPAQQAHLPLASLGRHGDDDGPVRGLHRRRGGDAGVGERLHPGELAADHAGGAIARAVDA